MTQIVEFAITLDHAKTIIATGLEHDGLPLVLIPGDGLFTVREVGS